MDGLPDPGGGWLGLGCDRRVQVHEDGNLPVLALLQLLVPAQLLDSARDGGAGPLQPPARKVKYVPWRQH